MDMPKNLFKQNLLRVPPMIGTWIMSGGTTTAEALGCVGFDFLVIDMEHVPLDWERTHASLQAVAGTGASAVTRIPWNDTVAVKRALDIGAQTLMFPMIQNAEEAKRAVASTRYPPDGIRGIAAVHRGSRYGTVPGYLKTASAEICVICQIETPSAAARLEEIAAWMRCSSAPAIWRGRWAIWATLPTRTCRPPWPSVRPRPKNWECRAALSAPIPIWSASSWPWATATSLSRRTWA
jgi:2-keto-3-deoxy-L-rhamnonate aldolase RhmA